MKKVLGIIGSPRKSGNCELIIKEISRNIPEEHDLKLLKLSDFQFKNCTACYQCLFKPSCYLQDDFYTVLEQIKEADGLIVAVPAYALGANASLKIFLDRCLAFYSHLDELGNKPAIGIALAGMEGKEGRTLLDLEGFLMGIGSKRKMAKTLYGALPGEVLLNEHNKDMAKKFANILFSEEEEQREICCPLCGSESFRFSEGNNIHCLICSNQGTIDMKNGIPEFNMNADHDFVLSHNAILDHGEWLKGMKKRFDSTKDQLKVIREEYKDDGTWVKPEKKAVKV